MKVLVFGASGNSGRYCVRRFLELGWTVTGVGRRSLKPNRLGFTYFAGDIRDRDFLSRLPSDFDVVVNFAGVQPSILKVTESTDFEATMDEYLNVNVNGVANVLNFVRNSRVGTYIYATTHRDIELHWHQGKLLANDLSLGIHYRGDHAMYALTKAFAGMMGEYFGAISDLRVFNLRLPMMFLVPESPYFLSNGEPRVMPFLEIIRRALSSEPLEIWGDPQLRRDYVHVENLASLTCLCIDSSLDGGTFSVGTGEGVTTERFVRSIGDTFAPRPDEVTYVYRQDLPTYKCATYDVSQQARLLGYKPILLDEMLQRLRNEIDMGDYVRKWGW